MIPQHQTPRVKSPDEIEKMRLAGKLTASVFEKIEPHVKKGISTLELNQICQDFMENELGATPAPLLQGFPKAICTSVNHVICHGIPSEKKLKEGDIIGIDISLEKNGYFGDSCKMFCVGKTSIQAERLVRLAQEALYRAIAIVKPGLNTKEIGRTIETFAKKNRLSVVQEYCGHGIGHQLHEPDLQIIHYYDPQHPGVILAPGHTFTIEPMINIGKRHTKLLQDDWTVVTKDHSLSAQWEHTLLVTETGCDILTQRPEEKF